MTACSDDTLWISDSNVLHKVKIERNTMKIIDAKDIKIYDMACIPSKDLLIVSKGSALREISGKTGEVTNSKYEVKDLLLSAVHVSSDGKVTVGGFRGKLRYPPVGRRAVIVMDRNGKHETTYEYDKQGNPIFTNICNITRTKNGNICIVDRLSKDARGRVVILSEDGDVLNTFHGHPEVNVSFQPMHSRTAISESIIVSNLSCSILYFLNKSGNFIGWCDTNKKGISHPYSFSSTKAGCIYIGCTTPEGISDNAKIYEVNIL
ncbi:unnamed protein product [Mytilus coruscus]|uniref:Uncharacterized protein n=1 Tax=Mytilus coruscus TaxID=42192 RepID=A0A6J8BDB3_MYTCO|nr:unnamed protein product [Mytilus coruscus]